MADLIRRLAAAGVAARAAVADTPGAAHALARHAAVPATIAPPRETENAIAALPIAGLRLAQETVSSLRRLGIERIGQLAAMARGPLARRFGPEVLLRLDQALGRVFEPLTPMRPLGVITSRLGFVEPLLTAEAFAFVIRQLAERVCEKLDQAGLGQAASICCSSGWMAPSRPCGLAPRGRAVMRPTWSACWTNGWRR